MEELAQRLQQLETQVGQQRAVIEHQQDQLMHEQTTIDADRAARTPVTSIAHDARGNLVDLRVGNKPETFAGETHEWKGWSFKIRTVRGGGRRTLPGTRECGSESVARVSLGPE